MTENLTQSFQLQQTRTHYQQQQVYMSSDMYMNHSSFYSICEKRVKTSFIWGETKRRGCDTVHTWVTVASASSTVPVWGSSVPKRGFLSSPRQDKHSPSCQHSTWVQTLQRAKLEGNHLCWQDSRETSETIGHEHDGEFYHDRYTSRLLTQAHKLKQFLNGTTTQEQACLEL